MNHSPTYFSALLLASAPAAATSIPPTLADYEAALGLSDGYAKLVDTPDGVSWQDDDLVVYRRTVAGVPRFMIIDPAARTQRPAFDNTRLVSALNKESGGDYAPDRLPFRRIKLVDGGRAIKFRIGNSIWTCTTGSYACERRALTPDDYRYDGGERYDPTPASANDEHETTCAPDKSACAFVRDYNIFVRSGQNEAVRLSWDGSAGNYYSIRALEWSPDSKRIAALQIRPGFERQIRFIDSSPKEQNQPKYPTLIYPKAGDVLTLQQPVLFDVAERSEHRIDNSLFPNPFSLEDLHWWKDGRGFTFSYNQRGHQLYRIVEVEAATATPRVLIDEASSTFVNYSPLSDNQQDTGKIYRHDVEDGREILWASERDGHEHLYLFDGRTGRMKNQITKGPWVVRAVNHVDDKSRRIYFEASGMVPGEDPYFVHAYRIDFDGGNLVPLTPATANHRVKFSDDGRYYTDLWSRPDLAPTLALYRTSDNVRLITAMRSDTAKLRAAGWSPPEPFVAKGRDGQTDIWGLIYRPTNFDPKRHYPVIEDIYAGPQGSFVPKSFSPRTEALTRLGFVVARIDGMGTNNRSRAFHDVAWRNLADSGFPDRIAWHRAVAARYPWYDLSKVGVFGTSAGGQSTVAALEFHPEFYKAGAANSGSYDNRMDKIWWNEQWLGWPVGPQYAASSTVDNAYRLKGKLLVTVGELDHNVDPSSAFQLFDRSIRAGKLIDILYVPGADHGTPGPYYQLKMMDFFVRNIMDAPTPDWNAVGPKLPEYHPEPADLDL